MHVCPIFQALLIFLSMSVYALSVSLRVNLNGSTYMNHHPNPELRATSNSEYRVPTVPSHTNFLTPPVQTLERGTLTDAPMPEGKILKKRVNYIDENDNEVYDQNQTENDDAEEETKDFSAQETTTNFGEGKINQLNACFKKLLLRTKFDSTATKFIPERFYCEFLI